MKLDQSFEVRAPIERVWETLIDVDEWRRLPGCEVTEAGEDGTYRGTFSVRLGPTSAAYRGELKLEELDEAADRVTMRATGQDKRGQGSAKATIVSTMHTEGDATQVEVETDLTITGRLARFGRGGMIEDISNRLMKEFSTASSSGSRRRPSPSRGIIDAVLAATPEGAAVAPPAAGGSKSGTTTKPLGGFSLFFRALLDRLRRLFRRG